MRGKLAQLLEIELDEIFFFSVLFLACITNSCQGNQQNSKLSC